MYNQYGQATGEGGLFASATPAKVFAKAPALSTTEIKIIVDGLNKPPFMSNLSLVEFDDKAPLELLELLNRVLGHLEAQHLSVDIQRETQDKTQERICGFLKVLGYPSDFNPSFQRDVVHGEKKTIQHLLHWLITKMDELKRRSYTAKFLVPLEIPDEFLGDEEMRDTFQMYKDLQAEFQATHQNVDHMRSESMNPSELKKEINQLEQEKEQLLTKINMFKTKSNKADFAALLEATSKLRKEQEQDAKLGEKERELTNMMEFYEQNVLTVQQRLSDIKKVSNQHLTPDKLLDNLRTDTRKNRDLQNENLGRELYDKRERLQRMELLLQEPVTTQNELERLTNDVKRLQKECMLLDDKLKVNAPADDKLGIFKSQAAMLAKKKDQKQAEIKKLEMEKQALEKTMADKESEYARTRGGKYMKRDDFRQYAANLRGKNTQYKQMKKILSEIKSEVTVLNRTKQVLESRAEDLGDFMKDLEKKQGVAGYTDIEDKIQGVSNMKEILDNQKDQTLQEITETVRQIEEEVKNRKQQLAPEIKRLRELREQIKGIEATYLVKKKQYDNICMNLDQEKEKMESDVNTVFNDYREDERKYHQNNIQTEIYDAFLARISNESKFLTQPDKRLTNEFKSYSEFFSAKLRQQENIVKDLKAHQKHIKDNSENYSVQMSQFKNLKQLLEIKRKTGKEGGDGLVGYEDTNAQAQGYDRFVVRD